MVNVEKKKALYLKSVSIEQVSDNQMKMFILHSYLCAVVALKCETSLILCYRKLLSWCCP